MKGMPLDAMPRLDLIALLELSDDAASSGLQPFLERALILCTEWFEASGATLFLRVDDGQDYVLAARAGIDATAPLGARIRHGQGIAGIAAESGEPMKLTDPMEHAQLEGRIQKRREEIGSSLVVPLRTRHFGPLGVLCLSRRKEESEFSARDLQMAKSVGGQVALAVANARLYTQAMDAVSESRALHEKLEAVVECLGVGILVVDRQGWVTEVNQESVVLFGRRPRSLEAWIEFARCGPEALVTPIESALDQALSGARAEARASYAAHDRTWSLVASPMPGGGAVLAIQDISQSERVQRELVETRRLAEIGQMTSAIAHEIRNPLTGIRGAAQMVCEAGGESAEFGEIVREETDKLDRLCGEFLEFARPFELHVRPTQLSELLERVVELQRPEYEAANVRLVFESDENEPKISVDPNRIEQVARNLIRNALQASSAGDEVRVKRTKRGFEVADRGVGMSEEQQERLFTPFFTTKPQGTGLGLSVVKKIVDAHGGEVRIKSEWGRGTVVQVALIRGK